MKYRKLRIAWSVGWGLVAVMLCLLWVRSHWRFDSVSWGSTSGAYGSLFSLRGFIIFVKGDNPNNTSAGLDFDIGLVALQPFVDSAGEPVMSNVLGLRWYSSHGVSAFRSLIVAIPHWMAMILAAIAGTASYFFYRFSLRTLLIATTLIAVVLGLVVWAVR